MNPLPRFIGMALFVVLAVLAALVAAPIWQRARDPRLAAAPSVTRSAPVALPAATGPAKIANLSQRAVLVLALVGLALTAVLLFSAAIKPTPTNASRPPFASAQQEMGTLARLAESTAAQSAELSHERGVRRRAEEDAQLKHDLLAQSVDEKIRLGRDLHDGIIQSLYAVGLNLETVRPLLRDDPAAAEARLEQVRGTLNAAIRDVRGYITGLAPENLKRASFSRSLAALFEQLRAGREATFEINIDEEAAGLLTNEQSIEALQIAREAISNALRHGHASQITIRLHQGEREVGLLVQDNGQGFDPGSGRDGGHGLGNMRARAERLGASLRISSRPGEGVRVIATFPTAAA